MPTASAQKNTQKAIAKEAVPRLFKKRQANTTGNFFLFVQV